jgi:hypothetical protein
MFVRFANGDVRLIHIDSHANVVTSLGRASVRQRAWDIVPVKRKPMRVRKVYSNDVASLSPLLYRYT